MDIKNILRSCTVDGNIVKLPATQLDRNIYLEVKKSLELIGGKWKGGKVQGFVFEQDPTELLLKIAGGEACNLKKEFQFFETPFRIADRLVALAEIKPSDKVLEPSAGRGAIVSAVHRIYPYMTVEGCELMDINVSFLEKIPNFRLVGRDFLAQCSGKYNVIVANPPFSKNQDINHIMKMESPSAPRRTSCLRCGDSLAIRSRKDGRNVPRMAGKARGGGLSDRTRRVQGIGNDDRNLYH